MEGDGGEKERKWEKIKPNGKPVGERKRWRTRDMPHSDIPHRDVSHRDMPQRHMPHRLMVYFSEI